MTELDSTASSKVAISELLTALGVSRVVCIDDTYANGPFLENLLVAQQGLSDSELKTAISQFIDSVPGDSEVRKQKLRKLWEDSTAQERILIRESVLAALSKKGTPFAIEDLRHAAIIEDLLDGAEFVALSPSDWPTQKDSLMNAAGLRNTLFLFDQDLTGDGGSQTGGMSLIADILNAESSTSAMCGLLTHMATPGNFESERARLANENGISKERFLVVPKSFLSQAPEVFPRMLKLIALSPDLVNLKREIDAVITNGTKSASESVSGISINTLDHIVFRTSESEGLWEPEMLLRLHALWFRRACRSELHSNTAIEQFAKRIRGVSRIAVTTDPAAVSEAWRIQQSELYEEVDYLNSNHLPVDLGDIFKNTNPESTTRYILLGQPCDLMVRADGKRSYGLECVTLAKIASKVDKDHKFAERMEYFGDDSSSESWVKLRPTFFVRLSILDLCAFNADGTAKIELGETCPEGIRPSWQARFRQLQVQYSELIGKLRAFDDSAHDSEEVKRDKAAVRNGAISTLLGGSPFRGKPTKVNEKAVVSFNCQRVGRLRTDRSFALLMAHTSCLSRPAFDADFGKRRESEIASA